jgi:hypothetical protein
MTMAPMYRKLQATLVVSALSLVASAALAGDKKITVDTGDAYLISWQENWVVDKPPPQAPAGSVTFHGADPKKWRVVVSPLPPHPTLTGDVGNLRIYVRNMARALENGGVQVDTEQNSFDGVSARGFYVQAHDSNPKAHVKGKDDPFTDGYTGAVSLNSKPYLFEVTWNPGGEADAKAAFAALKTIRKL